MTTFPDFDSIIVWDRQQRMLPANMGINGMSPGRSELLQGDKFGRVDLNIDDTRAKQQHSNLSHLSIRPSSIQLGMSWRVRHDTEDKHAMFRCICTIRSSRNMLLCEPHRAPVYACSTSHPWFPPRPVSCKIDVSFMLWESPEHKIVEYLAITVEKMLFPTSRKQVTQIIGTPLRITIQTWCKLQKLRKSYVEHVTSRRE